jgi:hypothetical protein
VTVTFLVTRPVTVYVTERVTARVTETSMDKQRLSAAERAKRYRERKKLTAVPLAGALAAITEAQQRRQTPHTPAYEWLWTHRKRLAKEFEPLRVVPWQRLAKYLNENGITGLNSKPVSPGSLRAAWRAISGKGSY